MRAYYCATLETFLTDDPERILGALAAKSAEQGFTDLKQRQTRAWERQISALKRTANELSMMAADSGQWGLLVEYPIPRRQKRIDAVILARDVIFCVEFKTEDRTHTLQARQQAEDYALDLRDFHEESRGRRIVPVAVALRAETGHPQVERRVLGLVSVPVSSDESELPSVIMSSLEPATRDGQIDAVKWNMSAYRPVPTIVQAAEALYAGHDVREIAHSHAGATNLTATTDRLVEIVREAQARNSKIACFVTGVPGAGKTLAGLNVVHNPALHEEGRPPGVFLSGNGPLVKIVRAAIERDFKRRVRDGLISPGRTVGTFIQSVHAFTRDGVERPGQAPVENVIVFDEAQRAWDLSQSRKKTGRDKSETETILEIMDRHEGWAVLIALVGGGQEINTGEAGLAEWGRVLSSSFMHWHIVTSRAALSGDASVAGQCLFPQGVPAGCNVREEEHLHLKVNLRSFRVQRLTEWVNAVLSCKPADACACMAELTEFPLKLTRELSVARTWLREQTRGLQRCGLVASSGALRLRAEGLELSTGFRQGNRDMYVNWFLNDWPDVRSSNQLEVVASEFECQGLELDWVGLCWGGDLTFNPADANWRFRHFSGSQWRFTQSKIDCDYLLNTYRVLLTRARQGGVIWIPRGCPDDSTREPECFDATADYLRQCGMTAL